MAFLKAADQKSTFDFVATQIERSASFLLASYVSDALRRGIEHFMDGEQKGSCIRFMRLLIKTMGLISVTYLLLLIIVLAAISFSLYL